jgi:hypothetical protein
MRAPHRVPRSGTTVEAPAFRPWNPGVPKSEGLQPRQVRELGWSKPVLLGWGSLCDTGALCTLQATRYPLCFCLCIRARPWSCRKNARRALPCCRRRRRMANPAPAGSPPTPHPAGLRPAQALPLSAPVTLLPYRYPTPNPPTGQMWKICQELSPKTKVMSKQTKRLPRQNTPTKLERLYTPFGILIIGRNIEICLSEP